MQHSIEAEIVETVSKVTPADDSLSADLEELLVQLKFLKDEALVNLAQNNFPKRDASKIEALYYKRQSEGLDETETEKLTELMRKFNQWFVLRNEAINLLLQEALM